MEYDVLFNNSTPDDSPDNLCHQSVPSVKGHVNSPPPGVVYHILCHKGKIGYLPYKEPPHSQIRRRYPMERRTMIKNLPEALKMVKEMNITADDE